MPYHFLGPQLTAFAAKSSLTAFTRSEFVFELPDATVRIAQGLAPARGDVVGESCIRQPCPV